MSSHKMYSNNIVDYQESIQFEMPEQKCLETY